MKKQVTKLGIAALIGATGCTSSQSSITIGGKVILDKHTQGVLIDTAQSHSTNRNGLHISNLNTEGIAHGDSISFKLDTVTKKADSIKIIASLN